MSTLTPTQDSTIYTLAAQMMADAASDADRARIDKALDLVETVERTVAPSVYLVRSASEPNRAYRVQNNLCNCPDTPRERGATCCKHSYAVQLFNRLERAEVDAEQSQPSATCPVCGARCRPGQQFCSVDHEKWYWADPVIRATPIRVDPGDSILDLWPGERPDLAPQCPRCGQEPRSTRHRDGLGLGCISRELFGETI